MQNYFVSPRVLLENEVQSSDAATKVIKLPLSNILHGLYIKVKCTNGATSCRNQSIDDVVDKIEVVANGSDVLISLTPREIRRWAWFANGLNLPEKRSEIAGAVQECTYPVWFGRSPVDDAYYLPCSHLSDLELRITYSPTIAATSFVTGTTTFNVLGVMSMGGEPGSYRGTLATKTLKAFTSAASGDEQTNLPRGNMLRQVMVYAYEAGIEDGVDVTKVKFDLNNDERVICNLSWNDIVDLNKIDHYVEALQSIIALTADTDTLDTGISRIQSVDVSLAAAADRAGDTVYHRAVTTIAGDRLTITADKGDWGGAAFDVDADATGRATHFEVRGVGVPHAVLIDLAQSGEVNLLNTSEYDQIRVTLTQGGAGADTRISTQEVRVL